MQLSLSGSCSTAVCLPGPLIGVSQADCFDFPSCFRFLECLAWCQRKHPVIVLNRKPVMVAHTCSANILEPKARGSQGPGQPRLMIPSPPPPTNKAKPAPTTTSKKCSFSCDQLSFLYCNKTRRRKTALYWGLMLSPDNSRQPVYIVRKEAWCTMG